MTLEELQELAERDLKINETELDLESLKTPQLHNKYLKLYSQERVRYHKLCSDRKQLVRFKTEYYLGDLNNPEDLKQYNIEPWLKKVLKTDVGTYVYGDKDVIQINLKIALLEEKISYVESILKSINGRNWEIRNAIEFLKFTNP